MLKINNKNLHLIYSVFFICLVPLVFFHYYANGMTMFVSDGLRQHVTALAYIGKFYREVLSNLFHGHFTLPQWDHNLGLGSDILMTLNYYAYGDPLDILAVFVPSRYTGTLYHAIIILRMYLIGTSFLLYIKHHKASPYGALTGSLIYAFSGYILYCGVRHPYFINPMIYLPLLCLGVDYIIEQKKPLLFSLCVWVSCISNFYFFYMCSILVLVYAFIRFFFYMDRDKYKEIGVYIGLAALAYIIGFFIASPIFIPQINNYLASPRVEEVGEDLALLYGLKYYFKMFYGVICPHTFGSYSVLGFASPVLPLLIYLVCKGKASKRDKELLTFFTVALVFLVFPVFGCIFNGFNYVTNRWSFACALVVSSIWALKIEDFLKDTKKNQSISIILSGLMALSVMGGSFLSGKVKEQFLLCYITLALYLILLYGYKSKNVREASNKEACGNSLGCKLQTLLGSRESYSKGLTILFVILGILSNSVTRYSPQHLNYIQNFITQDHAKTSFKEFEPFPLTDDEFVRVDSAALDIGNSPSVAGYKGVSYYWACTNGVLYDMYKAMGLGSGEMHLYGFEKNRRLLDIFSVKYLLNGSSGDWKDGNYAEDHDEEGNTLCDSTHGMLDVGAIPDWFIPTYKQYLCYDIYKNPEYLKFGFIVPKGSLPLLDKSVSGNTIANMKDQEFSDFVKDINISGYYLKDPIFKANYIKGSYSSVGSKTMIFSIPYSKGWKCKIDGKKDKLYLTDYALIACDIPEGNHTIELTYSTPLLKPSLILMILGLMGLAGLIYKKRK